MSDKHIQYMQLALDLAKQGRLTVSPNPMVGCVIVKDGNIIGQGYHHAAGGLHAEIVALHAAGENAKGASLYISLEPCAHHGRTPPCIDALIHAAIKEVYVATIDPNPLVAGKGIAALRAHGMAVHVGLLQTEAQQLNEIFMHYMTHQRPFVIAKWAMSLDGKTVTANKDEKSISSTAALQNTHALRQQVDAILIGAKTAIDDDPLLTVRHCTADPIRHPIRIILAGSQLLPAHLKLFDSNLPIPTIIVTTQDIELPNHSHIEKLLLPKNNDGRVDLPSLLQKLGERGITSVLVEGGMTILESFFREKLVNKVCVYVAPVFIGSQAKKQHLSGITMTQQAEDFMFTHHGAITYV